MSNLKIIDLRRKEIERKAEKNKRKEEKKYKNIQKWKNRLKNIPCFIVGNGPFLDKELPENKVYLLEDRFTIGINRTFLRIDPTLLVWQDTSLWYLEKKRLIKLKAIMFSRDRADPQNHFYHFKLYLTNSRLSEDPSTLYGHGSSGPIAFQVGFSLGCDPIILIGMDCRNKVDKNNKTIKTDFYGINPMHRLHTISSCRQGLTWIRDCKSGRTIINCSRNKVFPERRKLEDVLEELGDKGRGGREYFKNLLLKGKKD